MSPFQTRFKQWTAEHFLLLGFLRLYLLADFVITLNTRTYWRHPGLLSTFVGNLIGFWLALFLAPFIWRMLFLIQPYRGEHQAAIVALLKKDHFKPKRVFVRKRQLPNAAAMGFWMSRTIFLHSVVLEECTTEEIEAVTAHEIGHHRHHDPLHFVWLLALLATIASAISVMVSQQFGLGYLGALWLAQPTSLIALFCLAQWIKPRERQADHYAVKLIGSGQPLVQFFQRYISILKRERGIILPKEEPLISKLFFTHPWIYNRMKEMAQTQ